MKRTCDHCGKPITFGCMTNDYGDFYIHEECFEDRKGGMVMKCCLCGKEIIGWGNDPWPVVTDEDARCCDECNLSIVLIARLTNLKKGENENE